MEMGHVRIILLMDLREKLGLSAQSAINSAASVIVYGLRHRGYLKTCLQYTAGRDLRAVLRNGGTDEELKDRIRAALAEKPDGHHFREKAKEDDTESLCMSQIGG